MDILRAQAGDLDSVVPLFDGYRQFYGFVPDLEGARAFLAERFDRGDSVIFLAVSDGRAVGFTQLYPVFSSVRAATAWLLNDLYVAGPARREGVGRALLERARVHGVETGAAWLALSTGRDNRPAQRLYERLGWIQDTGYYHYELPLRHP